MGVFVVAGAAMLVAGTPLGIVLWRGPTTAALVAYEVLSALTVMVLVLMAEGFGRSGELALPVLLALVLFGGGLVFARALERWL
jgi:multisubunit Na+/H+ antiporter MnhF subunit